MKTLVPYYFVFVTMGLCLFLIANLIIVKRKAKATWLQFLKVSNQLEEAYRAVEDEISYRKKLERDYCNKEVVFNALLNSTTSVVCGKINDEIIYTNEAFKKMNRLTQKNGGEGQLLQYFKGKEIDYSGGPITKISKALVKDTVHVDYIQFASGKIYENRKHPLIINNKNSGEMWTINEISNSLQMQMDLFNSEERYRMLVYIMPDTILIHDSEEILYCNPSSVKLFNVNKAADLIGMKLWEVFTNIDSLIKTDYDVKYNTVEIINPRENVLAVEGNSVPFTQDDRNLIMTILRDATPKIESESLKLKFEKESQLLKEIMEYDKLKTDFFSNVSHELKTPLNIILGVIQLIEKKGHQQEVSNCCCNYKQIKMMKQNCYRLLRLINNLIDITRLDSGFEGIALENCNIVEVIESIVLSVAEYVELNGLQLTFDTEVEEIYTAVDVDKIERILLNLLSNAIKYTEKGGSIKVNIYDKESQVVIVVNDTGIGIPENMLNVVFERFRQVENLLSRKTEGSGIGLSLVKALVELHGGSISVDSKRGEGSSFIITLPIISVEMNHSVKATMEGSIERINIEFSDIYM